MVPHCFAPRTDRCLILQLYLRSNITQIPKNTLLPEDYVHRTNPVSNDENIKIKEEIEKLEKKLLEVGEKKLCFLNLCACLTFFFHVSRLIMLKGC